MQEGIEQGHQGTMSRKHLARDQKREGVMQDPQGGARRPAYKEEER